MSRTKINNISKTQAIFQNNSARKTMKEANLNSVLGKKILVDSYPDGRVYCWAELLHGLDAKTDVKVKVGYDCKKVYLLYRSNITEEDIVGMDFATKSRSDIHCMLLTKALQEAKDQHAKEMEKERENIAVPQGWKLETLFDLPFRIHKYFIDVNGLKSKKVYFSATSMRFWVQRSDVTSVAALVPAALNSAGTAI